MSSITGSCLCQSVKITIEPIENVFDACHCGMCRKWSGGGPALMVQSSTKAQLSGEESISIYGSSDWAERAFCKNCGTHLFYRMKDQKFWSYSAGLFKEAENFKFQVQIFVDFKPACYEFANKTEMMTEAQVLAMFSGK